MASLMARYLDGRTTRPVAVTAQIDASGVHLSSDTVKRSEAWATIDVAERTRHGSRRLTFQDGASLEFDDRTALDDALRDVGQRDGWVVGLQMSWKATLACAAALLVLLSVAYVWGLPWAAQVLAQRVPPAVEKKLGQTIYEQIDGRWLKPSKLDPERMERLRRRLEAAVQAQPSPMPPYRLEFRSGGTIGANALALPGGILVITDELIAMAPDDDAILGVLGHELGHVDHHHVTAQIIKASGLSMIAFVIWGDVSSLVTTAPVALMQASYSRQ
ncbi:MAG TPA: M48 family metallopeptidase [Aquabacterium sp.]|nr:M48 family metallopeptidase [Aquabacterium sp.]